MTLSGCVAGRVSTIANKELVTGSKIFVTDADALSVTSTQVKKLISGKLIEREYVIVSDEKAADAIVIYKYSVGGGVTEVISNYNSETGEKTFNTTTSYLRFFQIAIIDAKSSKPNKPDVIWKGEVFSNGSSPDIISVIKVFINVLFDNYSNSITNKRFDKFK